MTFVFKLTYFKTFSIVGLILTNILFINNYTNGQPKEKNGIKKIVIDPGHGGRDPGTIGSKSYEKDVTLSIALKLASLINRNFNDVEIIYTRKEDKSVPLDERSKIANASSADLFISIHCNANPSKSPYGTETYVMGLHKSEENLDVAMRENAVITYEDDYSSKYEGYDPKSTESFIIFTLMQNAFLDQSLSFADYIETEFRDNAKRKDRGVKQAGFLVLWKTAMPSVLVEVGYLSNPIEENYLLSESGQDNIAAAIYRAFATYKKYIENRSSLSTFVPVKKEVDTSSTSKIDNANEQKGAKDEIIFRVQLASSRKRIPINPKNFKNVDNVIEISSNGVYKYVVGNKRNYQEIVEYCQKIRKFFPDAFIIATKGGKAIPMDEALKELSI